MRYVSYEKIVGLTGENYSGEYMNKNRFFFQEPDDLIHNSNVFDLKEHYGAEYYFGYKKIGIEYRSDIAIFVHLYYLDLFNYCYYYIKRIATICDVFITTSNLEIKRIVEDKIKNGEIQNCRIELIKNQGYDIASLTVYNRELIKKYQYFCFVHDKKSGHLYSEESGKLWLETLWRNVLASPEYVVQIIDCFREHDKLGILSVPEPYWGEFISIVGNAWCGSYKDVVELAQKLKLNCVLSYDKPPITIGTAFWAKSDALKPLLEYKFSLNDFPQSGVGAISYAIERILPYVAQSQGYYTGSVATLEYAARRGLYLQKALTSAVSVLQHRYCWNNLYQINNVDKIYKKIDSLIMDYSNVYIYGTGAVAIEFIKCYPAILNRVKGFVVSEGKRKEKLFYEKVVFEIAELTNFKESAFIIAIRQNFFDDVINILQEKGVSKKQLVYANDLLQEIS